MWKPGKRAPYSDFPDGPCGPPLYFPAVGALENAGATIRSIKHFRERACARAFADGQVRIGETERAVIYKVSVTDPLKVGKAEAR